MSGPGRTAPGARLYRAALRLLPRGVRRRHGDSMLAMYRDACDDLAGVRRWRFAGRAFFDLAREIVHFRMPGGRDGIDEGAAAGLLSGVGQDFRVAARSLVARPGFSLVVIATLTVGIGLNTAIFTFVNGLLLRPLPYHDAGSLVQLSETAEDFEAIDLSLPDFALWRQETQAFEAMFAFDDTTFLVGGEGPVEPLPGAVVSPGFLAVLGMDLTLGRGFAADEERPGSDAVAVISHRVWVARFGSDPSVLGATLVLNGRPRSIVGVAPPDFHFPEVAEVWVPLAFEPEQADAFDYGYDAIGRLAPGVSIDDALNEGERIAGLLRAANPGTKDGIGTTVYALRYADVDGVLGLASVAALVAVTLVLLVACTNVASLMLGRGEARRQEMRTRQALGASSARLLRLVLVECGLLALVGCLGALIVAAASAAAFERLLPAERPFWLHFELDGRVLAWTLAAGAFASLVMGLAPALQAIRSHGSSPGSAHGSRVIGRGSRGLVTGQVAAAVVLVIVAGLAVASLAALTQTDTGVDPHGVHVVNVILPPWDYPTAAARAEGARRALDAASAVPGVTSAAIAGTLPFMSTGQEVAVEVEGRESERLPVGVRNPTAGPYFATLGIPLTAGRPPTSAEDLEGPPLAVVSQRFAERMWPDENPIGRRFRHSVPGARSPSIAPGQPWLTVVGVAGDVRAGGPGQPQRGEFYTSWWREPAVVAALVVRSAGSNASTASTSAAVRAAIALAEPAAGLRELPTLEAALAYSLATERFASWLLAGFAGLALGLALLGVHGVVAHATRRRAREIGVRVALGASATAIQRRVIGETLGLMFPGLAVGLATAVGISWVAGSYLYWVPAADPTTVALAAALFLAAGVVASWLPARGSARRDPTEALRAE